MIRRLVVFAAAAGVVAFACRPIPAPTDGVLSLSDVTLPSPAVVAGDTMRDSAGRAAPVSIVAYGTGGGSDTIANAAATFIMLDPGAHVTPDGYVIGDSVRSTPVRIVGSVGTLQTSPANIYVIPLPDSLADTTANPTDTVQFTPLDSTGTANYSVDLAGQVLATGVIPMAPVQGVIVYYSIVYAPQGANGEIAGLLVDPSGRPSSVDTSDVNGIVSRRIRVRPQAPIAADSFVVSMRAEYAGAPLRGSPWRFVIPTIGH